MLTCTNCKAPLGENDRFCANCGQSVQFENTKRGNKSVKLIIAFFISTLVFLMISNFVYAESDDLTTEIIIESIFIGITLGFSFTDWREIAPLYKFRNLNWKGLGYGIALPIASVAFVYFVISNLNIWLFDQDPSIMESYDSYDRPFFWAFVFICLVAPIFEELAFRGFLYNQIRAIASVRTTIIATGFMFALIHLSLFSIVWILPFGIALGFMRHKFKTLWWGMLAHFLHNFGVLLIDYYEYYGKLPFWIPPF